MNKCSFCPARKDCIIMEQTKAFNKLLRMQYGYYVEIYVYGCTVSEEVVKLGRNRTKLLS